MRHAVNRMFVLFAATAIVFAVSGLALGETLLFSDNYDTTTVGTDMNEGIGTAGNGRTGGLYETATYVQEGDAELGTNNEVGLPCVTVGVKYGWAWVDHNFVGSDAEGGMKITLTINDLMGAATDHRTWAGVGIGGPAALTGQTGSTDNDPRKQALLIGFRAGSSSTTEASPCEMLILEGGSNVTPDGTSWLNTAYDDAPHTFDIYVTSIDDDNPFDGVGSGKLHVEVYVDGSTTSAFSYTSSLEYTNNYIGLEDNRQYTAVDYFSVSKLSEVPEPSTLALLTAGLAGLLAYAWKKRK